MAGKERSEKEIIEELLARCDHALELVGEALESRVVPIGELTASLTSARETIAGELLEKARKRDLYTRDLHRKVKQAESQIASLNRMRADENDEALASKDEIDRLRGMVTQLGRDWV